MRFLETVASLIRTPGAALLVFFLSSCEQMLDQDPYSKMSTAINNNSGAAVRELLKSGVPADIHSKAGRTPLMLAAAKNRMDIMELLLENKADINLSDIRHQTALHLAARWGGRETVKYLLEHGANPNLRDYLSWTPLMWSVLQGRTEIAAVLLRGGAYLSITDATGNTPVVLAAWRGHADTVELLLAHGADPFHPNNAGRNAADVAENNGYPELAARLNALLKTAPAASGAQRDRRAAGK